MTQAPPHVPVMLDDVLDALKVQDGHTILDCTFGAGGYSRAILQAAQCRVIALDRDPTVKPYAQKLLDEFGDDRFSFVLTEFSKIYEAIQLLGVPYVDSIVADLGVSSMQLDQVERGFSFRASAPLDMRMTPSLPRTAADIIGEDSLDELTHLFRHYGEERHARRIAKAIELARQETVITDTVQLAELIRNAVPAAYANGAIHPATKVFQALRIQVNDELGHIQELMDTLPRSIAPEGRFVCVSFHSLEDGLIKQGLRTGFKPPQSGSRYLPETKKDIFVPVWSDISKKPLQPTELECQNNKRARSARLRHAKRSTHVFTD